LHGTKQESTKKVLRKASSRGSVFNMHFLALW